MPKVRCPWGTSEPLYEAYHDEEWGVPLHDDRQLFEMLVLEGAQAGLSWITVLKKRPAYRRAFARFDAKKIARFNAATVGKLLENPGIIRNRLKVESAIKTQTPRLPYYADCRFRFWPDTAAAIRAGKCCLTQALARW